MTSTTLSSVAIAGGGPAGAVAALVLARLGIAVTVFERSTEARDKIGDCLAPNTNPLLDLLELRERLAAGPHLQAYSNRSFWGYGQMVDHPFVSAQHGSGWRLDRRAFESTLASAAVEAGVQWHYGARVVGCEPAGAQWHLSILQNGVLQTHTADFLVDATGRRAAIAHRLGVERIRLDRLVAIAWRFAGGGAIEDAVTVVETVSGGWWYSGVRRDGSLEVYLATDPGLPDYRKARTVTGWQSLLEKAPQTWQRVQTCGGPPQGRPRVWIGGSERLGVLSGDRWLAIGDAAAAYDPVSTHGIGSAMGSGYYAGRTIFEILQGNADARDAYLTMMQQSFHAYAANHRQQYACERRWPDSPFWRRPL